MKRQKKIRWLVILPPWIIIAVIVLMNLLNYNAFVAVTTNIVNWILQNFAWMFNLISLSMVIVCVITYLSPIRNVRFGGSQAHPMVSYRNYVWIVLCTIMGAGLMLWACAEPMTHLYHPPVNVTEGAKSWQAIQWTMETIFLEWSFTPLAIYALPTILFAFVFYNMKKQFSIGSMLCPLIGDEKTRRIGSFIDMICLFCIATGLASTLGSGVLLVTEGASQISGGLIQANVNSWIICAVAIIATYTISASSGLQRGIKYLSTINAWFYLILGIFVFVFGPTGYILNLCVESLGGYLSDFFRISLWTSTAAGDGWSLWWPQFYWLMSFSWVPLSAVFLGRISRGYTVKETLDVVFIIPSVFTIVWMSIFSGSAIYYELNGRGINAAMEAGGTASATYAVMKCLPFAAVMIPIFLITAYISYVTAADSNTNAIAGLCTEGLTEEDSESPLGLKIFWGVTIGVLCIIMLAAYGIDGMKMLADLGGFPSAFLMILFIASWVKILKNPGKYDVHKEDYYENGQPNKTRRLAVEDEVKKKTKRNEVEK